MQITIHFEAQVRRAAGRSSTALQLHGPATVTDAVRQLARDSDEQLQRLLVDESGALRPTLMLFLNDEHVPWPADRPLDDAAVLTITSPISGG
jgi:molybdopterin converting factor small subunit